MLQRIKTLFRQNLQAIFTEGSFARNFAISFSGSALVTVIGFLLSPVISRLYTPEAYGLFAVFSSILNGVNTFSLMLYPMAFVRPKEDEKFVSLVQLSFFLALASLVLITIGTIIGGDWLLQFLNAEKLYNILFLLPLITFVANLNNIMISWYVRTKSFMMRSGVNVAINLSAKLSTIAYGFAFSGTTAAGFAFSDLLSRTLGVIISFNGGILRELKGLYRSFSFRRIFDVAVEYKRYPFFIVPATYINMLSSQLPIYMLTNFGATSVGLFAFSASMLEIPLTVLGTSVSPVFLQKAADTYNTNPERLGELSSAIYSKLLYLGLVPFGIITIFGDWIFSFVFGAEWEMAGVYSGYLGFYYIFRLIAYPLTSVFTVIGKENYEFYSNIWILAIRFAGLAIGIYLNDIGLAILLYSLGSLLFYFVLSQVVLKLLGVQILKVAVKTVSLVALTFALLKLVRMGLESFLAIS